MAMHAGRPQKNPLSFQCSHVPPPPPPSAHTLSVQLWPPEEAMRLHANTEAYSEQPHWRSGVWGTVKPADKHLGSGMLCSTRY